jgi:hypothetical protein
MSDSKSVTFDLGFEAETRGPAEAALTYTHLGGEGEGSAHVAQYHLSAQGGRGKSTRTQRACGLAWALGFPT